MNHRKPREPYGRQNGGQTIKSASLDADVALWLEQMAAKCNQSASRFVNSLLADLRGASHNHQPTMNTFPSVAPAPSQEGGLEPAPHVLDVKSWASRKDYPRLTPEQIAEINRQVQIAVDAYVAGFEAGRAA